MYYNGDIKFRGVSSSTKGLTVTAPPLVTHSEIYGDVNTIPGRDGSVFGEYGRYNDVPDAPDWLRRIVTERCSRFAELSICEAFSIGRAQSA